MTTIVLEMENSLACELEVSALRERKSVSVWTAERLKAAALEVSAGANGYPAGW